MSIKEYNFQEFTDKDMFEMRLSGATPDFGYITCKKRVPFLKFLVDNSFIEKTTELEHNNIYYGRFMPLMDFRFSKLFDYGPKPVIAIRECMLYTDRALRLGQWWTQDDR